MGLLFCNMSKSAYEKVRTGLKDNKLDDKYKKIKKNHEWYDLHTYSLRHLLIIRFIVK